MAASNTQKATNSSQPTKMQLIGYLIVIPAIFTTLMTIVLGISLGLFTFEPQARALQSFGHSIPLLGSVVPAPPQSEEDVQRLDLDQEKQALQIEWERIDSEKKKTEQRAKDLDAQEKALAEAAQKLSEGQKGKEDAKERIQKLVEMYAGMKSDDAARLMNELPDTTVVEILGAMDTSQVSKILAAMDSKRAVAVTQLLRR